MFLTSSIILSYPPSPFVYFSLLTSIFLSKRFLHLSILTALSPSNFLTHILSVFRYIISLISLFLTLSSSFLLSLFHSFFFHCTYSFSGSVTLYYFVTLTSPLSSCSILITFIFLSLSVCLSVSPNFPSGFPLVSLFKNASPPFSDESFVLVHPSFYLLGCFLTAYLSFYPLFLLIYNCFHSFTIIIVMEFT